MDATHQNLISKAASLSSRFRELRTEIEDVDTLFNGTPNYAAGITDQTIATVQSLVDAGLTAQDVADDIFILKTANLVAEQNNIAAFIKMANLG